MHSITGRVFDVSAGKEHYGAGTGYSGFTGTLPISLQLCDTLRYTLCAHMHQ
jgi:hypothetical protein